MLDEREVHSPTTIGRTEFAECLRHLHDEHKGIALAHVRRALKEEPQNPFFLSYVGMLCAVVEKRYRTGEKLCREALEIKCNHAQLYLNLAEVYHQAGRDGDAIKMLRKGFISTGRDLRIRNALEKIGGRRSPMFSSLGRSHAINRILGQLRHRVIGPVFRGNVGSADITLDGFLTVPLQSARR
jgi:tetratricopeptide (TPR) repeat protein